jgi:hypothetical protein
VSYGEVCKIAYDGHEYVVGGEGEYTTFLHGALGWAKSSCTTVGPLGLAMVHSSVHSNGRVKFPAFYKHLRPKVVQPEDSDGRYREPVNVCDLAAAGDNRIIVEADCEKAYAHCVHHAHH